MLLAFLSAAMIAAPSAQAQQVSGLNYNHLEVGGAVANSQVSSLSRQFNFKTKAVAIGGSYRLADNWYTFGDLERSSTNDRDFKSPYSMTVDSNSTAVIAGFGMIMPATNTTDIILELGGRYIKNEDSNQLVEHITKRQINSNNRESHSDALITLGVRSFFEEGYELTAKLSKAGDFQQISVGGPMYLNESLAIDLKYLRTKDSTQYQSYKSNAIALSVKVYF